MSNKKKNRKLTAGLSVFIALLLAPAFVYSQPTPTPTPDCTSNPIRVENCLSGTTDWQINYTKSTQPSDNHQIEGYASKTSVNVGGQIRFHIRANPIQTVNFEIYRLGYYNGNGARLVYFGHVVNVMAKTIPNPSTQTGIAECDWLSEATAFWDVPSDAVSGVYLVKLTGTNGGYQSYIPFVVRKDSYSSPLLFKIGVSTYQAYNNWPGWRNCLQYNLPDGNPCDAASIENPENGKSLYPYPNSGGPRLPGIPPAPAGGTVQARKVSFNRPYGIVGGFGIYDTAGAGFFNYEYPMIRFLESEGYDVTYVTDVDVENDPQPPTSSTNVLYPGKHKVLLSVGHDEYWSWKMRDNVEKARDHATLPLNIAFFSGNNVYWQTRFEDSLSGTQPANSPKRTLTCYKETATWSGSVLAQDPFYNDAPSANDYDITTLWRKNVGSLPDHPAKPPEDELIGVMTIPPEGDGPGGLHQPGPANGGSPIYSPGLNTVQFSWNSVPQWVMVGVGTQTLANLIGYEADELYRGTLGDTYPNHNPTKIIASSEFKAYRQIDPPPADPVLLSIGTAETTVYTLQSNGAKVFAASGQNWSWGLDNWGAENTVGPWPTFSTRKASLKTEAQQITRNILACFTTYASCGN